MRQNVTGGGMETEQQAQSDELKRVTRSRDNWRFIAFIALAGCASSVYSAFMRGASGCVC